MGRFMRTQNKGSYPLGGDDRYAQCGERHPDAVDEENHLAWSALWFGRVFISEKLLLHPNAPISYALVSGAQELVRAFLCFFAQVFLKVSNSRQGLFLLTSHHGCFLRSFQDGRSQQNDQLG